MTRNLCEIVNCHQSLDISTKCNTSNCFYGKGEWSQFTTFNSKITNKAPNQIKRALNKIRSVFKQNDKPQLS